MNIIAVDDEKGALWVLEQAILKATYNANVACFASPRKAVAYAKKIKVDVAFLDIEMRGESGIVLAKELKDINMDMNIIFVTGHSDYADSAFNLHASGYVLKPINPLRVAEELNDLRHPLEMPDEGIRVQCFGNFEIFSDGVPLVFSRSKSKEALAYLVDRKGAGVSKKELAAVLLEDKQYTRGTQSYVHIIITEMISALTKNHAEDIIIKNRNLYAVDPSKFNCDFYEYEKGNVQAINSYRGEYMSNYGWAEFRIGTLG